MDNVESEQSEIVKSLDEVVDLINSPEILDREKAIEKLAVLGIRLLTKSRTNEEYAALLSEAAESETEIDVLNSSISIHRESLEILSEERKQLEIEMQTLQNYLLGAGAGTWQWNIESNEERFDELFASMTGYSKTTSFHHTFIREDITNPEDLKISRAKLQKCIDDPEENIYVSEVRVTHKDGREMYIQDKGMVFERDENGKAKIILGTSIDITERKILEKYQQINTSILEIIGNTTDLQEMIAKIVDEIKSQTGIDAVGIRVKNAEDFPYLFQDGFSDDFMQTENSLIERGIDGEVCRDIDGNISLECTCGLVASGKTDPANPLFTKYGSFWTNDSTPLLDLTADQDPRHNSRNRCIHLGYSSVALIPIRGRDGIIGIIHLNDSQKGRFNQNIIQQLEKTAAHIGESLVRKQIEKEISDSEIQFRSLFEKASDGIIFISENDEITKLNYSFAKIHGYSLKEMQNMDIHDLDVDENSVALMLERNKQTFNGDEIQFEVKHYHKDGHIITLEVTQSVIYSGGKAHIVAFHRDVTERKQLERENLELTVRDEPTGLGNRRYIKQELEKLIRSGREYPISFISVDINDLKIINDTYGHTAGDRVIKIVADSLKESVRPLDHTVRMGGDEFLVVLPQTEEGTAQEIVARINAKLINDEARRPIRVSMGVATAVKKDEDLEKYISFADEKMYENKRILKNQKYSDI